MAQPVEPMDIDSSVCDFDNKENSFHHNNVPRTPCTEKGYEELDVSELNMKLRYSMTPASSPMSKSFTANCLDNRNVESETLNCENGNMTRSLHSTLVNESTAKKVLPLQVLSTDQGQVMDGNRNALRPLDTTSAVTNNNITVTVSCPNDIDENLSLPSSSSSMAHTPEATTPTKELPKGDASPIMRGLKSVLNMFRPSQSPVPLDDEVKPEVLSPPIVISPETSERSHVVSASTPLTGMKTKDPMKRISPNRDRDSLVFNDDLEKELQWRDDSTILFSNEKIPIHKLFFQQPKTDVTLCKTPKADIKNNEKEKLDTTVEYMDISYNDLAVLDKSDAKTVHRSEANAESDCEFLDCESTFNRNESLLEESFKSQEEDVAVRRNIQRESIHDIEPPEDLNNTTGTLSDTDETADLSAASTKTTTAMGFATPLKIISQPNDVEPVEAVTTPVEENIEVATPVSNKEVAQNYDVNKDCAVNKVEDTSGPKNLITSLAQIPLIMDPKVLLFNISEPTADHESENVPDESNKTPADMPLPDEDDIDSMPSIPLAAADVLKTDTADQPYDQDKVPTESAQESSQECLNDNKEIISVANNINQIPSIQTENVFLNDADKHNATDKVAVSAETAQENDKEKDSKVVPDKNENPFNSTVLIENKLPELTDISHILESHGLDVSALLSQTANNDTILRSIDDLINEIDFTKTPPSNAVQEDVNHPKIVEPMDISMTDVSAFDMHKVEETADSKISTEEVAKSNSFNPDLSIAPLKIKTTDTRVLDMNNEVENVNNTEPIITKTLMTAVNALPSEVEKIISSEQAAESEMVRIIGSDIESIKHEVEAIIATAMDIVAFKNTELNCETPDTPSEIDTIKLEGKDKFKIAQDIQSANCKMSLEDAVDLKESQNITEQIDEPSAFERIIEDETVAILFKKEVNTDQSVETAINDVNIKTADMIETGNDNGHVNIDSTVVEEKLLPTATSEASTLEHTAKISDTITQNRIDEEMPVVEESQAATQPELEKDTENIHQVPNAKLIEENKITLQVETREIKSDVNVDEEIVVSEDGSPFVSVSAEDLKPENNEQTGTPFEVDSPPLSPKIVSKGYNFNFDEIEDPFATKTKIRQSPPPGDLPHHSFEEIYKEKEIPRQEPKKEFNESNRRRPQPQRRKPIHGKKLNPTSAGKSNIDKTATKSEELPLSSISSEQQPKVKEDITVFKDETLMVDQVKETEEKSTNNVTQEIEGLDTTQTITDMVMDMEKKSLIESAPEIKSEKEVSPNEVSSSGQTTYYSAGTSSNESIEPKSAFNLPELDDPNFNPFATKSKMRQSPNPIIITEPFATKSEETSLNEIDPFVPKSKITKSPETSVHEAKTTETHVADTTENIEAPTDISPALDEKKEEIDETVQEITVINKSSSSVKTDEADTLEGPFLEGEDFCNDDKLSEIDSVNVGIMQFSELPSNIEPHTEAGELFIDAEAFEFLLNQNQANTVTDGAKESLFLKFDPLFAKRVSSDGVLSALKNVQKRQSTPKKEARSQIDTTFDKSPIVGPTGDNSPFSGSSANNITHDKSRFAGPTAMNVTHDKSSFAGLLVMNVTHDKSPFAGPSAINVTHDKSLFADPSAMNVTHDKLPFAGPSAMNVTHDKSPFAGPSVMNVTHDKSHFAGPSAMNVTHDKSPFAGPSAMNVTHDKSPFAGPSAMNVTHDIDTNKAAEDCEDLNVTVTKPMLVVNPAVNPVVTPRNRSSTPVRSNRQSLTFTSPAIAVIDRLLSLSANNSLVSHNGTITEVHRDHEADQALTQLRELLAEKEISVYNLRTESKELKDRLANMESQMKNLEAISHERLKKINELNNTLTEKTKLNRSMAKVVEEYERTIASLIAEIEQDKKRHADERMQLIKDRDEQTAHLASMEVSFSDLHSKYEKSKQVILGFKANEDSYKKSIREFEENLSKMQNNYELLKQHATSKLTHANDELQKINRAHESEVLKLNALIKRKELHITSLEETLQQKTKANEELTAICDELINKVG